MELTITTMVESTTTATIETPCAFRNPNLKGELLYIKNDTEAIHLLFTTLLDHVTGEESIARHYQKCNEAISIEEFKAAYDVIINKLSL
jgi:hypothetical protein